MYRFGVTGGDGEANTGGMITEESAPKTAQPGLGMMSHQQFHFLVFLQKWRTQVGGQPLNF
jgi:hypothetical protein